MKKIIFLTMAFVFSNVALAVESRTDEIEKFSPQTHAITIEELCATIQNGSIDWGKRTKLECLKNSDGTLQLRGSDSNRTLSVTANPTDKTVYEASGFDDIHLYKNDQKESFQVTFNFVTGGTKRLADGTLIEGSFRGDAILRSGSQMIRVGYYSH